MAQPTGKQTAFNREPSDTIALSLIGLGSVLQPLLIVAWVMVWISGRWSLGEKIFSVALPLVGYAVGIAIWNNGSPWYLVPLAGGIAAFLTCLGLSFRMGLHEAAAGREDS
jgi:hypothetical protein